MGQMTFSTTTVGIYLYHVPSQYPYPKEKNCIIQSAKLPTPSNIRGDLLRRSKKERVTNVGEGCVCVWGGLKPFIFYLKSFTIVEGSGEGVKLT
jgi:hypothetical protein